MWGAAEEESRTKELLEITPLMHLKPGNMLDTKAGPQKGVGGGVSHASLCPLTRELSIVCLWFQLSPRAHGLCE